MLTFDGLKRFQQTARTILSTLPNSAELSLIIAILLILGEKHKDRNGMDVIDTEIAAALLTALAIDNVSQVSSQSQLQTLNSELKGTLQNEITNHADSFAQLILFLESEAFNIISEPQKKRIINLFTAIDYFSKLANIPNQLIYHTVDGEQFGFHGEYHAQTTEAGHNALSRLQTSLVRGWNFCNKKGTLDTFLNKMTYAGICVEGKTNQALKWASIIEISNEETLEPFHDVMGRYFSEAQALLAALSVGHDITNAHVVMKILHDQDRTLPTDEYVGCKAITAASVTRFHNSLNFFDPANLDLIEEPKIFTQIARLPLEEQLYILKVALPYSSASHFQSIQYAISDYELIIEYFSSKAKKGNFIQIFQIMLQRNILGCQIKGLYLLNLMANYVDDYGLLPVCEYLSKNEELIKLIFSDVALLNKHTDFPITMAVKNKKAALLCLFSMIIPHYKNQFIYSVPLLIAINITDQQPVSDDSPIAEKNMVNVVLDFAHAAHRARNNIAFNFLYTVDNGYYLVHYFILHNRVDLLKKLEGLYNVNAQVADKNSPTPLILALTNDKVTVDTLKWLLALPRIDVNCLQKKQSALRYAIESKKIEKLFELLNHPNLYMSEEDYQAGKNSTDETIQAIFSGANSIVEEHRKKSEKYTAENMAKLYLRSAEEFNHFWKNENATIFLNLFAFELLTRILPDAINRNDLNFVIKLFSRFTPEQKNIFSSCTSINGSNTPLHLAMIGACQAPTTDLRLVKLFLDNNANLEALNGNNHVPLFAAALALPHPWNKARLRSLLRLTKDKFKKAKFATLFFLSASTDEFDVFSMLINMGPDFFKEHEFFYRNPLNKEPPDGYYAEHFLVDRNRVDLLKQLVHRKIIDLNCQCSREGPTPLIVALTCEKVKTPTLEWLLNQSDLDLHKTQDNKSPLYYALVNGDVEKIAIFLPKFSFEEIEKEIKVLKEIKNYSVLSHIVKHYQANNASLTIITNLIANIYFAEENISANHFSSFEAALKMVHMESQSVLVYQLLLKITPVAFKRKDQKIFKLLFGMLNDPDKKNILIHDFSSSYQTIFHMACRNGLDDIISLIVNSSANPIMLPRNNLIELVNIALSNNSIQDTTLQTMLVKMPALSEPVMQQVNFEKCSAEKKVTINCFKQVQLILQNSRDAKVNHLENNARSEFINRLLDNPTNNLVNNVGRARFIINHFHHFNHSSTGPLEEPQFKGPNALNEFCTTYNQLYYLARDNARDEWARSIREEAEKIALSLRPGLTPMQYKQLCNQPVFSLPRHFAFFKLSSRNTETQMRLLRGSIESRI